MNTTFTILLIGYLLASYISTLYQWRKLQIKLQTDMEYMPLKFIIDAVTSKVDFFKSWEWKFFLAIAFLLLSPFIFPTTVKSFIKKLLKKRKQQSVEVPEPIMPMEVPTELPLPANFKVPNN